MSIDQVGPSMERLAATVTGRSESLFGNDMQRARARVREGVEGRRLLVVGGAGSIGAATVHELLAFRPATLHVVDQDENGLVELVRDLRSRPQGLRVADFRALPLDFGSSHFQRFLDGSEPYDAVLNFAALKHVRSEKDVSSLLQLLDTNVLKPARLLLWLSARGTCRYFCVSTDKAANPVSLMGASKRIMERLIFSSETSGAGGVVPTSARFANVAFSNGSLLDGFLRRLRAGQPLACPEDTRRYFVTGRESGHICTLAAFATPSHHVLVPRFDPSNLLDLQRAAEAVLREFGLEPEICRNEAEARSGVARALARGRYPLLLTPRNTSGEKPYEEFVGEGEEARETGFAELVAIAYRPTEPGAVRAFLERLESWLAEPGHPLTKSEVVEAMSTVVPELRHLETGLSLDERM